MKSLFSKYGQLGEVSVPFDRLTGKNKGFAFIAYKERADAAAARDDLLSTDIEGRKLKVDWDIGLKTKGIIIKEKQPSILHSTN